MEDKLKKPIGILGGTFDPIHLGHIQIAQHSLNQIDFEKILFIPCFKPAHRTPPITPIHDRVNMIKLALEEYNNPQFVFDNTETQRQGVSYSAITLKLLREKYPDTPLCFILGFDSFATLDQWYHADELLSLAHFIVVNRPMDNLSLSSSLKRLMQQHETNDPLTLHQTLAGKIYHLHIPAINISATEIRKQLEAGHDINHLLPTSVLLYIQENNLYLPHK